MKYAIAFLVAWLLGGFAFAQTADPKANAALTILSDEKSAAEQRAMNLYVELQSVKQQLADVQKKLVAKGTLHK